MQSRGPIIVFTVLLTLACIFYLSFTWVTRQVEADAEQYALQVISSPQYQEMAKKLSGGNAAAAQIVLDSLKEKIADRYLDSMKKEVVYDIGIAEYTFEECRKNELNLGLDLRGGMNVTLEVSIIDIIRSLSDYNPDKDFNKALEETQKNLGVNNNDDFITLFEKTYRRIAPNGRLAPIFQTQENKDAISYNSSNEEVIRFIRTKVNEAVSNAEKTFRSRIDRFGVAQPNIRKLEASGRIMVELPGVKDKQRVRELLQGTANLEFWETYENAEIAPLFDKANFVVRQELFPETLTPSQLNPLDSASADSKKDTLKTSVATSDTLSGKNKDTSKTASTPTVNAQDTAYKNFLKRYPLYSMSSPLKPNIIFDEKGQPKQYAEGPVLGRAYSKADTAKINQYLKIAMQKKVFPAKLKFMWSAKAIDQRDESGRVVGSYFELYAIKQTDSKGRPALYGDIITDARKDYDQRSGGSPLISMSMTGEAANKWKNITKANVGRCIAIVMDNMVYSAPRVNQEISGGQSQITGNFTDEEAEALAAILSAGKLPAPARIVEENIVGPTLGKESIESGLYSFIIALLVIMVFMGLYYNKAGWVANIALILNMFFIMGVLTSLGAVLTLPGIAGIVLTIGLAVDANILIFERVREELAQGKSVSTAIKEGYRHAMSSIIDANVTLLILGLILYAFGTGPVQGFATTLCVGIISSLFSAILITMVIFDYMQQKKMEITFDNSITRNAFKNVNIRFVERRKIYYAISSFVILLGIIFYFKNGGLNLGVDFKGGRTYLVRFNDPVNTEDIKKALAVPFGEAPEVKTLGSPNQIKVTTTYKVSDPSADADKTAEEALMNGLNTLNKKYEILSQQKVGPTIATDIVYGAYGAVLFSCIMMFIYIVIRFRKWQYGLGSVVALFHDVLVVLSCYAIFDKVLPFSMEIGQDFIAAILTVMGYTMTETVVVFDRIREKLNLSGKKDLQGEERISLINYALNSTLSRTILTSLTVFFVLVVIFIWGGESIRGFIFALLIGRIIGTYSSLCISTPIVVDFDKRSK